MARSTKTLSVGLIAVLGCLFASIGAHADTIFVGELGSGFSHPEIRKFDSNGNWVSFAQSAPYALAVDTSGNLFASSAGGSIVKYDPSGNPSVFSSQGAGGLAFDPSGNLFASSGGSILKYNPNGNSTVFSASGVSSLAFTLSGTLYGISGNTILRFDSNGNPSLFASGLSSPRGLACDSNGNLFVGNAGNNTVVKFDPSGNSSVFANSGLDDIFDLDFDSGGNLYVVNSAGGSGNWSIEKFDSNGSGTLFTSQVAFPLSIAIQVPEPTTWTLLVLGVIVLFGSRRLHRRSSQSD